MAEPQSDPLAELRQQRGWVEGHGGAVHLDGVTNDFNYSQIVNLTDIYFYDNILSISYENWHL